MNLKEAELVTVSSETYNLCAGGKGGFGYINENKLGRIGFLDLDYSKRVEISRKGGKATCLKNLKRLNWTGRNHTEETKAKMRKPKNQGSSNSQFGSMWITNGTENKKMKSNDIIPDGWYKGRK